MQNLAFLGIEKPLGGHRSLILGHFELLHGFADVIVKAILNQHDRVFGLTPGSE